MILTVLLNALLLLSPSQPVKVYIEAGIVTYMINRGFGHYETLMVGQSSAQRPDGRHRDYLRGDPRKGDMVILLEPDTWKRLLDLEETGSDMEMFDRAIRQARAVDLSKDLPTELPTLKPPPVENISEPPRHSNSAFIPCVVLSTVDVSVHAQCNGKPDRFPLVPAWRWTLPRERGTRFYYEQSGNCRVVHAEHSHAIMFNERRAAINCEP